jgi:predicted nucleic acid-binding protein
MAVLVDTSVWIDHFRTEDRKLSELLEIASVVCHPFVVGELACGNLSNRTEILTYLDILPSAAQASLTDILDFIEIHELMGRGIGYIDVHLLASAKLEGVRLWTRDRRLHSVARSMGIAWDAG